MRRSQRACANGARESFIDSTVSSRLFPVKPRLPHGCLSPSAPAPPESGPGRVAPSLSRVDPIGGGSAAGLPRQRRHRAAARRGHRGDHRLLPGGQRQSRPHPSRVGAASQRRVRGRPAGGYRVHRRGGPAGGDLHPRHHRGNQSRRHRVGRRQPSPRRRGPADHRGACLFHASLAARGAASRRLGALGGRER